MRSAMVFIIRTYTGIRQAILLVCVQSGLLHSYVVNRISVNAAKASYEIASCSYLRQSSFLLRLAVWCIAIVR